MLALHRIEEVPIAVAQSNLEGFPLQGGTRRIPLAEAETREVMKVYVRYGKGQGHPAQLNLGDCFSYACARRQGAPLLFIGNDFSQTDIPSALA